MAHHAKHSPAIRALAPRVARALRRDGSSRVCAAFEATYRTRAFVGVDVSRTTRTAPSPRLGAADRRASPGRAARRAAQLFSWCRRVLAESRAARNDRPREARTTPRAPRQRRVHLQPQQHAALAVEHEDASEDEYVDEKVDFTRLRKPAGARRTASSTSSSTSCTGDPPRAARAPSRRGRRMEPKHLVAHRVQDGAAAGSAKNVGDVRADDEHRVDGARRTTSPAAIRRISVRRGAAASDGGYAGRGGDQVRAGRVRVGDEVRLLEEGGVRADHAGGHVLPKHARPPSTTSREVLPIQGGTSMDRAESWRCGGAGHGGG